MDYKINLLNKQVCFKGFFTLEKYTLTHSLFAGGMCEPVNRELFSHGNAVAILLYDPDADAVVIIEQFRVGAMNDPDSAWVYELVAGFQEAGESIEQVVERELKEEAGLTLDRYEMIMQYYSNPASSSDRVILVCAQVDASLAGGIHGVETEGEDIKVHVVNFAQVGDLITSGKLSSPTPIIAMQWLQLQRDRLRQEWGTLRPAR